jgi:hypothetical protein
MDSPLRYPLSPFLYAMYVNDIEIELIKQG